MIVTARPIDVSKAGSRRMLCCHRSFVLFLDIGRRRAEITQAPIEAARAMAAARASPNSSLGRDLRCRFVHFNLSAHFLETRGKRFDLLLLLREFYLKLVPLLRNGGFLPMDLPFLFLHLAF